MIRSSAARFRGVRTIQSRDTARNARMATRSGAGAVTVPGMPLDELIEREKIRRVDFL
jgi:hypothetical protein